MTEPDIQDNVSTKFKYKTFGPFRLASNDDLSALSDANEFWDEMDNKHLKLRSAIGIYIFAVQSTKTSALIPWYVGKTERGFEKRFHAHRKLFAKLLNKNGSAAVFLIARLNRNSERFMGPRKKLESNNVLETMLIERCLDTNPKLFNASKVKYVKGLVVPGFKGTVKGKPKAWAQDLSIMLKVRS